MTETHEVHISRYFAATPAEVYQAFVDPAHLAQWFGPLVYHCPVDTIAVDPRPGGQWRMTMVHNDDPSQTSPIDSTFVEVVENQLLVGYEIAENFPGVPDGTKITMSVELVAEGDGTRLELRQGPFPVDMSHMATIGWGQAFHKLDGLFDTPAAFRPGGGPQG